MLFATNRIPEEGIKTKIDREVNFDPQNITASQHMFFCEREGEDNYKEIGKDNFFTKLKKDECKQILLFIHGFNNPMEKGAFKKASALQELLDNNRKSDKGSTRVIPLIWPCDDDGVVAILDDYHDDRRTADISAKSFARMLGKFDTWRCQQKKGEECYKRINILAHSMGNRVLQGALKCWSDYFSPAVQMPQLFRNIYMVAADMPNKILEKGGGGEYISQAARNVVVYFASDDYAMPASKVANIFHDRLWLARRLGMTGPNLNKVPENVYRVDCDDFNNTFDHPKGHTYFLGKNGDLSEPSPVIDHIITSLETGRVQPPDRHHQLPYPPGRVS